MWVGPEECGCIESVFFFELKELAPSGPKDGSDDAGNGARRFADLSETINGLQGNADEQSAPKQSSADDWFVKPLYTLTYSGLRDLYPSGGAKKHPFLRIQLATMSRGEVGADRTHSTSAWCHFLIVHRTTPVSCDRQLARELQRLYVSSHAQLSVTTDGSTVHLSGLAANEVVLMCKFDVSLDQLGLWQRLDARRPTSRSSEASSAPPLSAAPVDCEPLGGVIALLGPRFANPRGTEYLVSPPRWGADDRWLWMMTECPPRVADNCDDHLQQRDTPNAEPSDLFFDIAGRKACVGRYATVVIDTRALDADVIRHPRQSRRTWATAPRAAGPSLQWSLLYDYVHRWLTESLVVAMTQRTVLYRLSSELLKPQTQANFAGFLQELFTFRRTFWWEHLHRHPTAVAFSQFQQYFRLPSLMAQLSTEVEDYYQQEQQNSAVRLNDLVALFAAITVGLGLLQVSSLRGFDAPYFAIALGGIAALGLIFLLFRIRRRPRHPRPVGIHP